MTSDEASVLCLGELVFDVHAEGPLLAGAPLHAAVHLARAGVRTGLLTAVGADPMGREAAAFLAGEGIRGLRVHPTLPTGTVEVELKGAGVPVFTIRSPSAWTDLAGALPSDPPQKPCLVVFCGLGLHPAGNRRLLEELLASWRGDEAPPILCDLNLRPGWAEEEAARWSLDHCHYLKVNDEELAFLGRMDGLEGPGLEQSLMRRHSLRGICTTHGPDGVSWRDGRGAWTLPVQAGGRPLVDTVGAGDAVTAALALGLLHFESPEVFLARGIRWAAEVCAIRGGILPRTARA